ncbi:hypothetical protein LIER_21495 [Lithospermum erythrorhizon]|uniref:Uncharacterized protein n=1 Tax=Lithospermum erythrorhizon TaxID=34254 RepID=A0AAV3QW74_LITER
MIEEEKDGTKITPNICEVHRTCCGKEYFGFFVSPPAPPRKEGSVEGHGVGTRSHASHEVSRLWLHAAFASVALADGNSALHQRTLRLGEELSQEHLKVEALEEELRGLRLQATTTSNLPWELALMALDLQRVEKRRWVDLQLAERRMEDVLRALQDELPIDLSTEPPCRWLRLGELFSVQPGPSPPTPGSGRGVHAPVSRRMV